MTLTSDLADVDSGHAFHDLRQPLHDLEDLSRQFGCPDVSLAAGDHRHLLGLRQRSSDLCSNLEGNQKYDWLND